MTIIRSSGKVRARNSERTEHLLTNVEYNRRLKALGIQVRVPHVQPERPAIVGEPTSLQREARAAALAYEGKFGFLVKMRHQARQDEAWYPTPRQAVGILKSTAWQSAGPPPGNRR